jgi:hypothetical protein
MEDVSSKEPRQKDIELTEHALLFMEETNKLITDFEKDIMRLGSGLEKSFNNMRITNYDLEN